MSARIASRLKKAETILGVRRECSCEQGGKPAVYYPDDGDVKPSSICPSCGGHRVIVCVVYELPQFPNYDEAERMPLSEGAIQRTGRIRHE